MDPQEFAAWTAVTQASRDGWVMDMITYLNRHEMRFYTGGAAGRYLSITRDGLAVCGTYSGAIPHIGEAVFRPQHRRQFTSQDAALAYLAERWGVGFLEPRVA